MSGVVLMNPSSGKDDAGDEVRRQFTSHRVVECDPHRLGDEVAEAVRRNLDFVAVAGGDGTISAATQLMRATGVPLLPVPAGTRNHFARQLGIVDFEAARRAASGRIEAVDVGEVNDHCFINNSAIGMYPEMVERREALQGRGLPKRIAQILADFAQLARGHRFNVTVEGVTYRAWMIFVGNGHYGEDMLDLASRQSLNQGVLDVRLVRADRFLARIRVLASLALGRLHRSPLLVQRIVSEITFDFDTPTVEVALDGEVVTVDAPLCYRSRVGDLRVLIQSETEHTPHPHVLPRRHLHPTGDQPPSAMWAPSSTRRGPGL
jgi:diacylglycerol kinase family enzyme